MVATASSDRMEYLYHKEYGIVLKGPYFYLTCNSGGGAQWLWWWLLR